jgi:outer membrane protein assembly factor BamB
MKGFGRRAYHIGLAGYAIFIASALARSSPHLLGPPLRKQSPTPLEVFGSDPFRGRLSRTLTDPTFVYRGSNARLGVDLANSFEGPLTLAWQFSPVNKGIHSAAKSSPAVDASGVYVGSDASNFYAVNFDGTLRWSFHVDNAPQGIHSTAALDADNVYFGDYKGRFYALRKQDGDVVWANQLGETIGSSAAIVGPAVYIAVERNRPFDGFVAKLDRRTGAVLWFSDWLGDQAHASPTVNEAGGALYVGANNGVFRALALDTGQERWRTALEGAVKSTAVLAGDSLYVTTAAGLLYALEVESGQIRWRAALSGTAKGSPSYVPDEDLLVVGSNVGTARHAEGGQVRALRARDGETVWSMDTDFGNMRASPTVMKSGYAAAKYVGWLPCAERAICAFSTGTGEVLDRLELPASFTGTPAFYDGRMYITLFNGGLLAFQPQ